MNFPQINHKLGKNIFQMKEKMILEIKCRIIKSIHRLKKDQVVTKIINNRIRAIVLTNPKKSEV